MYSFFLILHFYMNIICHFSNSFCHAYVQYFYDISKFHYEQRSWLLGNDVYYCQWFVRNACKDRLFSLFCCLYICHKVFFLSMHFVNCSHTFPNCCILLWPWFLFDLNRQPWPSHTKSLHTCSDLDIFRYWCMA